MLKLLVGSRCLAFSRRQARQAEPLSHHICFLWLRDHLCPSHNLRVGHHHRLAMAQISQRGAATQEAGVGIGPPQPGQPEPLDDPFCISVELDAILQRVMPIRVDLESILAKVMLPDDEHPQYLQRVTNLLKNMIDQVLSKRFRSEPSSIRSHPQESPPSSRRSSLSSNTMANAYPSARDSASRNSRDTMSPFSSDEENQPSNAKAGVFSLEEEMEALKRPDHIWARSIKEAQRAGEFPYVGTIDQWWMVLQIALQRVLQDLPREGKGKKRKRGGVEVPSGTVRTTLSAKELKQVFRRVSKNVLEMAYIFGIAGVDRLRLFLQVVRSSDQACLTQPPSTPTSGQTVARELMSHFARGLEKRGQSEIERWHRTCSEAKMHACYRQLVREYEDETSATREDMDSLGFKRGQGRGTTTLCALYALHVARGWPLEELHVKVAEQTPALSNEYTTLQQTLSVAKTFDMWESTFTRGVFLFLPEDSCR